MRDYFEVGIITTTHGLKGEVKVQVISDDPYRLEYLDSVFITVKGVRRDLVLENIRYFKNQAIVKFEDLDRIEDVEGLRGVKLCIDRDQAEPLEEGEYYRSDLYDCHVYLEDGASFGIVSDVIETGANDVLVIKREGKKEVLVPVIKDCMVEIAPAEDRIVIHLIKGLLSE
ncbi:MAG: ribosome maturation factor RimM [Lachnospiraceae bacterium]|nr:ribosome maturation factor RimM [Lachnospiraceae bacterium]